MRGFYEAKTIMTGYSIGLKDPGLYVAVPKKYFRDGGVTVQHGNKVKIYSEKSIVLRETFNDRFKPGKVYTLCYLLWEKRTKEALQKGLL